MIPTHAGRSSYYTQYMTSTSNRRSHAGGGNGGSSEQIMKERLLTDRDAYLGHLEDQLHRVTAALMLADEVKTQQVDLQRQVATLQTRVDASSLFLKESEEQRERDRLLAERASESSRSALQEKLETIEDLTQRLSNLELEHEKQRRSQTLITKINQVEERTERSEERIEDEHKVHQEQIHRLMLQLKEAQVSHQQLDTKHRDLQEKQREMGSELRQAMNTQQTSLKEDLHLLRDVELPKALNELRINQERGMQEVTKDFARLRHEMSMSENRLFSTLTKQASLTQEQVNQLQELIQEVASNATATSSNGGTTDIGLAYQQQYAMMVQQKQQMKKGSDSSSNSPRLPPAAGGEQGGSGDEQDGLGRGAAEYHHYQHQQQQQSPLPLAAAASVEALGKRFVLLSAAFRNADESLKKDLTEARQAVESVQQSLALIGKKMVETAHLQTEAMIEAMSQLEARVDSLVGLGVEVERMDNRLDQAFLALGELEEKIEDLIIKSQERKQKEKEQRPEGEQEGNGLSTTGINIMEGREEAYQKLVETCASMHKVLTRTAKGLEALKEKVDSSTVTYPSAPSAGAERGGQQQADNDDEGGLPRVLTPRARISISSPLAAAGPNSNLHQKEGGEDRLARERRRLSTMSSPVSRPASRSPPPLSLSPCSGMAAASASPRCETVAVGGEEGRSRTLSPRRPTVPEGGRRTLSPRRSAVGGDGGGGGGAYPTTTSPRRGTVAEEGGRRRTLSPKRLTVTEGGGEGEGELSASPRRSAVAVPGEERELLPRGSTEGGEGGRRRTLSPSISTIGIGEGRGEGRGASPSSRRSSAAVSSPRGGHERRTSFSPSTSSLIRKNSAAVSSGSPRGKSGHERRISSASFSRSGRRESATVGHSISPRGQHERVASSSSVSSYLRRSSDAVNDSSSPRGNFSIHERATSSSSVKSSPSRRRGPSTSIVDGFIAAISQSQQQQQPSQHEQEQQQKFEEQQLQQQHRSEQQRQQEVLPSPLDVEERRSPDEVGGRSEGRGGGTVGIVSSPLLVPLSSPSLQSRQIGEERRRIEAGISSPIMLKAARAIQHSPVKFGSSKECAIETLKIIDSMSIEEVRDAHLKEVLKEVGELFTAVNKEHLRAGHKTCCSPPRHSPHPPPSSLATAATHSSRSRSITRPSTSSSISKRRSFAPAPTPPSSSSGKQRGGDSSNGISRPSSSSRRAVPSSSSTSSSYRPPFFR